jgi:hypothetical protein
LVVQSCPSYPHFSQHPTGAPAFTQTPPVHSQHTSGEADATLVNISDIISITIKLASNNTVTFFIAYPSLCFYYVLVSLSKTVYKTLGAIDTGYKHRKLA